MDKTLKGKLENFLNNFNAIEINEYFATEYDDDWTNIYIKEKNENITKVLEYLNDSFIDIDTKYRDTDEFELKVKQTLNNALKMLL